jgi:hypothetical protein
MTPELNLAAIALMMTLTIAAYFEGKNAARDEEQERNDRRRKHRHRQRLHREEI